jgi:hypothetical protein
VVTAVGEVRPPQPVKLFIATLYEDPKVLVHLLPRLTERLGDIEWQSDPIPFTYTDYYRDIGERLLRVFLVFRELVDPGILPEVKLFTNELEKSTADATHPRRINLDPGTSTGGRLSSPRPKTSPTGCTLGEVFTLRPLSNGRRVTSVLSPTRTPTTRAKLTDQSCGRSASSIGLPSTLCLRIQRAPDRADETGEVLRESPPPGPPHRR